MSVKGMVYHFKIANFKEAEICYLESLKYKKWTNDLLGQGISNGLLGSLYYQRGMTLKKDSDDTLTMGAKTNLDSALNHYTENFKLS